MLEAVHLLLAFPLFVVVVGVDARWLSRSLAMRHPRLLAVDESVGDGAAAPRDYLAKIFQIPFWLEPLDTEAARQMLRGLLPEAARAEPSAPATPAAGGDSDPVVEVDVGAEPAILPETGAEETAAPTREIASEALEMGVHELEVMEMLAPLLGRSPRALKRFVNTYRLVKARLGEPVSFGVERNPIRHDDATMLLLAIATGSPRLGPRLLDDLLNPGPVGQSLADALELLSTDRDECVAREASAVLGWLRGEAPGEWETLDAAALRRWAEHVVRFSFRDAAPRIGSTTANGGARTSATGRG